MRATDMRRPQRCGACGLAALAAALLCIAATAQAADPAPLRVCADPDNMPFSSAAVPGFENRLADLVGGELGRPVAYTWAAENSDFIHDTLNAGRCDVVIGVPKALGSVDTTRPYYWSSYVLLSRTDRGLDITSLKDHRLRGMKIGVTQVEGNRLYSPPAQVLAELGLIDNIVGLPIDDPDAGDPRARTIDALVAGNIDIAALWGPATGYYTLHSAVPLTMVTIGDTDEFSARKVHFRLLGLQFEIAMGVRKGDELLRRALDRVIAQKQPQITALLKSYGVPLIEPAELAAAAPRVGGAD